jgi:hypothetical protein
MATNPHSEGYEPEQEIHPDAEAWLAEVIGDSRVGEFSDAELQGDSEETGDRAEWQGFVSECRTEATARETIEALRARALSERILNRTVREDLSVRADWRLVGNFVRQRLASSGLLRVVAASLLLHFCALPVMAYYVWVMPEPEPSIQVHVGEDAEELPFHILEPEQDQALSVNEEVLPALQNLEALSALFRAHRLPNSNGESGAADEVVWADDLGLVVRMEMLYAREVSGSSSELHQDRLRSTLAKIELCMDRLRTNHEQPFLRRLAASAWLRARRLRAETAQSAEPLENSLREFECRALLGSKGPLKGADWQDACIQAESELENRAK